MNLEQRRIWNENHKLLTEIIVKPAEHQKAIELFCKQHVLLYSSGTKTKEGRTFEDELLADIREETLRKYPVKSQDTRNPIVWHLWHSARIEDMTMNVLVGNTEQILHSDDWLQRMKVQFCHSGNEMNEEEIAELSSQIEIQALLSYRVAVGRRTREIIKSLQPEQFKQKVEADRLRRLVDEGAVKENAGWLVDYWSKKTIVGLVLMPATRHNFVHLNKSMRIKNKIQKGS